MCIIFYKLLHHLHDKHQLLLAQHVHLHNFDFFSGDQEIIPLDSAWKLKQRILYVLILNYSTTYMMSTTYQITSILLHLFT